MKNYYSSNPTFYLGIDCIIFGFNEGEISLLLLKRNFEPAMGEWSLMGGFVQKTKAWTTLPNVYWLNLQVWKTYTWNRWEPSRHRPRSRRKGSFDCLLCADQHQ